MSPQRRFSRWPGGDGRVQAGLGVGAGGIGAGHRRSTGRQRLGVQRSKVLHVTHTDGAAASEMWSRSVLILLSLVVVCVTSQGFTAGPSEARHSGRRGPDRSSGVRNTLCPVCVHHFKGTVQVCTTRVIWLNWSVSSFPQVPDEAAVHRSDSSRSLRRG